MKLLNSTQYDTNSLRKLFTRCLREQTKVEGKLTEYQRKKLKVIVKYSKKDNVAGRAFLNGITTKMFIPRNNPNMVSVAFVFLHELLHIRGYNHKSIYDATVKEMAATFANGYSLIVKEPVIKITNMQETRYLHAVSMVNTKEKAIKRLQGQLRKWATKKKYYEKALAAKKDRNEINN